MGSLVVDGVLGAGRVGDALEDVRGGDVEVCAGLDGDVGAVRMREVSGRRGR